VRAIEAGDAETGVTIMRMAAGLDTGPMLLSESLPIALDDNAARLHDKLAALGARLVVDALHRIDALTPEPQPTDGVTYAHKIDKAEALLDFARPAEELARRIRAFDPFPGAAGVIAGVTVKLWSAVAERNRRAGTVVRSPVEVSLRRACCASQPRSLAATPAGRRLPARFAIAAGSRFGGAIVSAWARPTG
jgi:methionyl-tRNA formyltransferase